MMIQIDDAVLERALDTVTANIFLPGLRPNGRRSIERLQTQLAEQRRRASQHANDMAHLAVCPECGVRMDRCPECGDPLPVSVAISEPTTGGTT